ncbi:MAG: TIGR03560 family F420-dependent LLM class oxidoreductase [bacterium]|nr:TIGR03560 family F420-dependent LLM class oxidoreductase [bacterium]
MRALFVALLLAFALPVAAADPPTPRLRFGIQTPPQNTTWDDLRAIWQEADRLGFHSAWLYDHFMPIFDSNEDGPVLEGWTTLAALARETTSLRIGLLVDGNTYRNPALVAKMATTIDHLSNGRVQLGIGAGWFEREHQAYGFHFGTARERARRLDEALQVITKLWDEKHPTFAGKYYTLDRAPFAPANVQRPHPPIVIGGQGKEWIVPLVARYGDAWNAVTGVTLDGIRERRAIIAAECARIGRAPCPTEVSALVPLVAITNVPLAGPAVRLGARLLVGKDVADAVIADAPETIRERLAAYADAGVTEVVLSLRPPFDPRLLQRFAEEIMPAFSPPEGPKNRR